MAKIISLDGMAREPPAEPDARLIGTLQALLTKAEAGEIMALAGVYVSDDEQPQYFTAIPPDVVRGSAFFVLHSGAVCLAHQVTHSLVTTACVLDTDFGGDDDAA